MNYDVSSFTNFVATRSKTKKAAEMTGRQLILPDNQLETKDGASSDESFAGEETSSTSSFINSNTFESQTFDIDFAARASDTASLKVRRLRANDRERRRVNLINSAMETLKKVVPMLRGRRKITKLELLRCANRYILLLNQALITGKAPEELEEIQYRYPARIDAFQPMYFAYYPQQNPMFY